MRLNQVSLPSIKLSLIVKAIEFGQPEVLRFLLTESKLEQDLGLLHRLCSLPRNTQECFEMIKVVLRYDRFADINGQDEVGGNTPIHLAAATGKTQVLSYLLQNYHPCIYLKNKVGCSPIDAAASKEVLLVNQ